MWNFLHFFIHFIIHNVTPTILLVSLFRNDKGMRVFLSSRVCVIRVSLKQMFFNLFKY